MISHLPVSDFWVKKIHFQEGYKIEIFIFTTGGADPKAEGGEVSGNRISSWSTFVN